MAEKPFEDGQILTADQLNTVLGDLSKRITEHTHTGSTQGPKLGQASLANGAVGEEQLKDQSVTEQKLSTALFRTLKDGPTTAAVIRWTPFVFGPLQADAQADSADKPAKKSPPDKAEATPSETAKKSQPAKAEATPGGVTAENMLIGIGLPKVDFSKLIPIYQEFQFSGGNIKSVNRRQSKGDSLADPSVIRIEFAKAYKDTNYVVSVTPEWSNPPHYLLVVRRDKGYVDLTVPTGKLNDLNVSFSLTIFGELT